MNKEDSIDLKVIQNLLYENAEVGYIHPTHHEDMLRYYYMQQGDMRAVEEAMQTIDAAKQGILSADPLRNMKYLFVVTVSLASRFALEAGLPLETSYAISDLYIQKMDLLTSIEEIRELTGQVYATYVTEIRKIKSQNTYSRPIMRCLNYITSHFNEPITLGQLAEEVHLNPNYLSSLFKKETGESLRDHLIRVRIEVAQSLLARTDYTYSQISNSLAFCSQSHFTQVFKAKTGYTPKEYRMKFYDSNISKILSHAKG